MKIARLHYITQKGPQGESHSEMAEEACKNGIEWVQLRIKDLSDEEHLHEAKKTQQICERFGAKLIINDRVDIAKKAKAYGVHLGKEDMPIKLARKKLGDDRIIGGTANDLQTMINLAENGVDYIGLGPFRFTETKENLSPELGLEGYQSLIEEFEQLGYNTPVIAIGGITQRDIIPLLQKGLHGVAIASAINYAPDMACSARNIQTILDQWKN